MADKLIHRKIKILFLIDDFGGAEGGTEQHLLFLQRELPRDIFDLHFGVLTGIQRFSPDLFSVHPVMLGKDTRHGLHGAFRRLQNLSQLIKTVHADVVHAFCRTSEIYACLAVRLARRGKVLGIRRNVGYWQNWRSRSVARFVGLFGGAHYAANCEAAQQFATQVEWISPKRVYVIQNPISRRRLTEGFANILPRSSLGITEDEHIVGMVAVIKPVKDYSTFLHAARLVLDKFPRTRFLVIGCEEDQEYAKRMQQLACQLSIDDRICWLGPIPNPICVLSHMDVAVLSSQSEALSNSILEYAAVGIATVATDVGGTREIIDNGQTGFIVPPNSPDKVAERIIQLLSSPNLRRSMGDKARLKARTVFSEARILSEYRRLYSELVFTNRSHKA